MAAGEDEEALRYCDTALELARAIGHTPTIADAERTAPRLLLKQGRSTEAAARAEAAAAAFRSMGAAEEAESALQVAVEARAA